MKRVLAATLVSGVMACVGCNEGSDGATFVPPPGTSGPPANAGSTSGDPSVAETSGSTTASTVGDQSTTAPPIPVGSTGTDLTTAGESGSETGGSVMPPPAQSGCPHGLHGLGWGGGGAYACARTSDGGAACWAGPTAEAALVTYVGGTEVTEVRQVSTGMAHGCVVLDTGAVHCWGDGTMTGLGEASTALQVLETPTVASGASMIAAGDQHTCALVEGGSVQCWGSSAGRLGVGSNTAQGVVEAMISGPAVSITASSTHTCAVLADGTLECWGDNDHGKLGMPNTGQVLTPTPVPGLASIVGAAGGPRHTCALEDGGAMYCWGNNMAGQLGLDPLVLELPMPSLRIISSGAEAVSAGPSQTLVVRDDGRLTLYGSPTFTATDVAAVSGGAIGCLAFTDGTVSCWDSTATGEVTPTPIAFADGTPLEVAPPTCD